MLGGARARCAIEKAPQCESLGGARARCRPGRTRKLAILAPTDAHDERRRVRHGGRTGVDLELHDPAYWPTGLLAYIDVLAYWPTGWWSGLCAVCAEREGGCVCAHLNACVGQREGRGGGGEETDGASGVAARLQRASNSPLDASSLSRLEAADGWRTAGWWQRAPGLARGRSRRIGMSREPGVALGFGPGPFGLTIPSLLFLSCLDWRGNTWTLRAKLGPASICSD